MNIIIKSAIKGKKMGEGNIAIVVRGNHVAIKTQLNELTGNQMCMLVTHLSILTDELKNGYAKTIQRMEK